MLVPLNDKVVVRRDTADSISKGGIVIPATAQKNDACSGVVLAVGPGTTVSGYCDLRFPCTVKPEDNVIFNQFSGSSIKIDGEDLLIMSETDILAVRK